MLRPSFGQLFRRAPSLTPTAVSTSLSASCAGGVASSSACRRRSRPSFGALRSDEGGPRQLSSGLPFSFGSSSPSSRHFATAAFTVRPPAKEEKSVAKEQVLFVVGLNTGKFYGKDGAEEGLKLLERITEHGQKFSLLFSMTEKELKELEEDHKVDPRRGKLTPSRDLEHERNAEMIPLIQAGMADKSPRRALSRTIRTTQGRVTWALWKTPRECLTMYWAYWKRKQFKDVQRRAFASLHFPMASHMYYGEASELVAIRATEHMIIEHLQGNGGATLLVVQNELFDPVVARLKLTFDEDALKKMSDAEFARGLRERASELTREYPDLTALLVFLYCGLPMLLTQQGYLAVEYLITGGGSDPTQEFIQQRD